MQNVQHLCCAHETAPSTVKAYPKLPRRDGLSKQEAEDIVKEAIALAMSRDGSSGGVIRLCTINAEGVQRQLFQGPQIPTFWDELGSSAEVGMVVG